MKTRNISLSLLLSLLIILPGLSLEARKPRDPRNGWRMDKRRSYIKFQMPARVVNVKGKFRKFSLGSLQMKKNKATSLKGAILIRTASVNTKNKKRDDHLLADDFFWSKKYPLARIQVKKVIYDDEEYEVTFSLHIRNKARTYTIPLDLEISKKRITAEGEFTVSRAHFDLTGNYSQNLIMKDKATLTFKIVLKKR